MPVGASGRIEGNSLTLKGKIPAMLCVAAPLAWAGLAGPAEAADSGEAIYAKNCQDCHGKQAESKAFGKSRPLRDLDQGTIVDAVITRRAKKPPSAGDRAKAALSDEDLAAVSAYLSGLSKP